MESTLNLSMTELLGEGGAFLGWGRDTTRWTTKKADDVKSCGQSMLRKFYFQAMIDPRDSSHSWTFLKPVADIPIGASDDTTFELGIPIGALADLPDDFGGFEGLASMSQTGTSGGFWPLKQVSEEQIRVRYAASPTFVGRPLFIAEVQMKGDSPTRSNRSRLCVFPIPDQAYTLHVPYYFLPNYLTIANPYPYGGAAHAETMKAGMRAAAELFLDNLPGPENANYMQCLAASISYDRRHQPKTLGVNTDLSDWRRNRRGPWPDGLWDARGIGFLSEASYV